MQNARSFHKIYINSKSHQKRQKGYVISNMKDKEQNIEQLVRFLQDTNTTVWIIPFWRIIVLEIFLPD